MTNLFRQIVTIATLYDRIESSIQTVKISKFTNKEEKPNWKIRNIACNLIIRNMWK